MLDESLPGGACFPQNAEEASLMMPAWLGYLQGTESRTAEHLSTGTNPLWLI